MFKTNIAVGGEYTLEVIRDGVPTGKVAKFQNLIPDSGLNMLCAGTGTFLDRAWASEDNTPPTTSDTVVPGIVFTYSGSFTGVSHGTGAVTANYRQVFCEVQCLFPINTAVARNIAKVGVGNASSGLLSISLIKDSGGTPTTFPILVGEQLRLTYRLTYYGPRANVSAGTVTLDGVPYTVTIHNNYASFGQAAGNWDNAVGIIWNNGGNSYTSSPMPVNDTTAPASSSSVIPVVNTPAYVIGSFKRTVTLTYGPASFTVPFLAIRPTWGPNILGYSSNGWPFGSPWLYFSASVPKSNLNVLTIQTEWTLSRYTP